MEDKPLSNDPRENLRMENELLRLQLKAETGADSNSLGSTPVEIENLFLKHVLEFERAYATVKQIKIFDLLGKPTFKNAEQLTEQAIGQALTALTKLLSDNQIEIDYTGEYDDRTKYRFITEELFDCETDDITVSSEMIRHFSYEEFHPNHPLDIENRTVEFITSWFDQKLDEKHWAIADSLMLPDRTVLSKLELAGKFKQIFDCFTEFTDCKYVIHDIQFQFQNESGMGHSEGLVKYTAILENGEKTVIEGPFKLYFSFEYGWWSIFYFIFPGFSF
ncbi:MAG: hypothetical protein JWQ25_2817 [Daejeonella sp.]|nr:hypothetical protein [Daejeonella sp.]